MILVLRILMSSRLIVCIFIKLRLKKKCLKCLGFITCILAFIRFEMHYYYSTALVFTHLLISKTRRRKMDVNITLAIFLWGFLILLEHVSFWTKTFDFKWEALEFSSCVILHVLYRWDFNISCYATNIKPLFIALVDWW